MDIETYNRREKMLKLREELLAAEKKKEILSAMRSLSQTPQRFPFFEEMYIPPNKYHKMFIENCYLILYQIQDDTVYIEYLLDCRKDYSWFMH